MLSEVADNQLVEIRDLEIYLTESECQIISSTQVSYQEIWLKNGSLRPAAGDKSNYNQSNLAAAIIFTCYISLINDFTVAIFPDFYLKESSQTVYVAYSVFMTGALEH